MSPGLFDSQIACGQSGEVAGGWSSVKWERLFCTNVPPFHLKILCRTGISCRLTEDILQIAYLLKKNDGMLQVAWYMAGCHWPDLSESRYVRTFGRCDFVTYTDQQASSGTSSPSLTGECVIFPVLTFIKPRFSI
jgi:hypothetical protein